MWTQPKIGRTEVRVSKASLLSSACCGCGWQSVISILIVLYLNKSFANHGVPAEMAEEAFIVPGQGLEGHELSAA